MGFKENLEKYVLKYFGKKCEDYEQTCSVCSAWRTVELLLECIEEEKKKKKNEQKFD